MRQLRLFWKRFVSFAVFIPLFGCIPPSQGSLNLSSTESKVYIENGIKFLEEFDRGRADFLERAESSFEIAMQANGDSPLPYDGLACVAARQNDFPKARYYLDMAIDKDPGYGRAYSNLAFIAYKENRIFEAESLLRKSIELNQFDVHANNNLGSLLFNELLSRKESEREVEKLFHKARELSPLKSDLIETNIKILKYKKELKRSN